VPQKSETRGSSPVARGSSPTVKEGSSVFSSESEPSFTVGLLPRALMATFEGKAQSSKYKALSKNHFASGNTGSISTGTLFNLSSADCIGGLITANLSSIAFAFT